MDSDARLDCWIYCLGKGAYILHINSRGLNLFDQEDSLCKSLNFQIVYLLSTVTQNE